MGQARALPAAEPPELLSLGGAHADLHVGGFSAESIVTLLKPVLSERPWSPAPNILGSYLSGPEPCDHILSCRCAGKVPGDDCPLVWGQCSHCFHMHCILKWLNAQQVQQHCPMCRQEWKFKE